MYQRSQKSLMVLSPLDKGWSLTVDQSIFSSKVLHCSFTWQQQIYVTVSTPVTAPQVWSSISVFPLTSLLKRRTWFHGVVGMVIFLPHLPGLLASRCYLWDLTGVFIWYRFYMSKRPWKRWVLIVVAFSLTVTPVLFIQVLSIYNALLR